MSDRVSVSVDEQGVADVRLNRPDKMNACDTEMFGALSAAGNALASDRSLRAVVLSGEGRAFCAGADLTYFETIFAQPVLIPPFLQKITDCMAQMESLPVPVMMPVTWLTLRRPV